MSAVLRHPSSRPSTAIVATQGMYSALTIAKVTICDVVMNVEMLTTAPPASTVANTSRSCSASSLRSTANTSVSPATMGSSSRPSTIGPSRVPRSQIQPVSYSTPSAMLPSRMIGAASHTNSRNLRHVLRATCRTTGRRNGNISMTSTPLSPGHQAVQAQPREDHDDDEHEVGEHGVLPAGDAGDARR